MSSEDPAGASLLGEIGHLSATVLTLEALIPEADMGLVALRRAADRHAETLETNKYRRAVGKMRHTGWNAVIFCCFRLSLLRSNCV